MKTYHCNQYLPSVETSCQNMVEEGSEHFPFCSYDCHMKYAETVKTPESINIIKAREAAKIGHNNLISKGYILLKEGSYYTYILKDWLPRFVKEGVLTVVNGVYMPNRWKIAELTALDAEYREFLKVRKYQRALSDGERKSLDNIDPKALNS